MCRYAYVQYKDIRELKGMEDQTIFAIKALPGTKLEVPDPDEVVLKHTSLLSPIHSLSHSFIHSLSLPPILNKLQQTIEFTIVCNSILFFL
jgi:hypothetical protein